MRTWFWIAIVSAVALVQLFYVPATRACATRCLRCAWQDAAAWCEPGAQSGAAGLRLAARNPSPLLMANEALNR